MKQNRKFPYGSNCTWEVDIHNGQEDFKSMENRVYIKYFKNISIHFEGKTNFYLTPI